MAFGYKYWMVYLPEYNRASFLLFVHNPAGATKLRDYSSGWEHVLAQPRLEGVLRGTEEGKTRFRVDEHLTTDDSYWLRRTEEFNLRHLLPARSFLPAIGSPVSHHSGQRGTVVAGRASHGSRRQLQDYVNEHEGSLSLAVLDVLPPRLRELGVHLRWVSPLAQDNWCEYRDADFLRVLGLEEAIPELQKFWPSSGPSWDALARVSDSNASWRRTR